MTAISRLRRDQPTESGTIWIKVADLIVDHRYQAPEDTRRIRRIAEDMDPDALGVLHVSIRTDGTKAIVDGQHRRGALLHLGWADQLVECKPYYGLTFADEARLFYKLNESRKVQALPKFRARVQAGEAVAVHIQQILTENGWHVPQHGNNTAGTFMAVAAAEIVYKGDRGMPGSDGRAALATTVRTLTEAWGHDTSGVNAYLVRGIGLLYTRHPEADRSSLVRKLAAYPGGPNALLGAAKGLHSFRGGTLPHAVAEVCVELYNKRRTAGRLPDWRS